MKANKAQIVSDRMRRIARGGYTPFQEGSPQKKALNPYDRIYSNLPRYNGRISWQPSAGAKRRAAGAPKMRKWRVPKARTQEKKYLL